MLRINCFGFHFAAMNTGLIVFFCFCATLLLSETRKAIPFAGNGWIFGLFLVLILILCGRRTRFTAKRHFEAVCDVINLSIRAKDTYDAKAMIAVIRNSDGAIELIDTALLKFLDYNGPLRPHNVFDIIDRDIWQSLERMDKDTIRGRASLRPNQNKGFRTAWAKKVDNSLARVSICRNRLSDSLSEIIIFTSEPKIRNTRYNPIGHLVKQMSQVSVGDELSYDQAFVILLAIVENSVFSRSSSSEVLAWMHRVHAIIEYHFQKHRLRLIETRGDSILALTTPCDEPNPASRALLGTSAVARALQSQERTSVRVGIACGQATVARLRCAHSGDVLLLFGDVANVAGRLEQSGDAASVHVCGRTAQSFAEEQGMECPPIEVINIPLRTS
jgi:class 3 adenylate cyclase